MRTRLCCTVAMLAAPLLVCAQIQLPASPHHGSDGVFDLTGSSGEFVIDLSHSRLANWTDAGGDVNFDGFGDGVYDPVQWAVVFKFSEVVIPAGVTVRFVNHPARAPVVWLVGDSVRIDGVIDVSGALGHALGDSPQFAEPGPGGFRGGNGGVGGDHSVAGFGPGGGNASSNNGHAGSYGTAGGSGDCGSSGSAGEVYGNEGVFPLIGGSGGSGNNDIGGAGGGAGGGAILIVAQTSVVVNGSIFADGGGSNGWGGVPCSQHNWSGAGSGGSIRLISDQVSGNGQLFARGGGAVFFGGSPGGDGRIRIEANDSVTVATTPAPSLGLAGSIARVWPEQDTPLIMGIRVNGIEVTDPASSLAFPDTDLLLEDGVGVVVQVATQNVPPTWTVLIRVVPKEGEDYEQTAMWDAVAQKWVAQLDLPNGLSAFQVRAASPG